MGVACVNPVDVSPECLQALATNTPFDPNGSSDDPTEALQTLGHLAAGRARSVSVSVVLDALTRHLALFSHADEAATERKYAEAVTGSPESVAWRLRLLELRTVLGALDTARREAAMQ